MMMSLWSCHVVKISGVTTEIDGLCDFDIFSHRGPYLEPLFGLFLALHRQHQSVGPLVDDLQLVLLLFSIFGDVSDAAP